jgi:hypothetical protein
MRTALESFSYMSICDMLYCYLMTFLWGYIVYR